MRLDQIFPTEDSYRDVAWHVVEGPVKRYLGAVTAHTGEFLIEVGRHVEHHVQLL